MKRQELTVSASSKQITVLLAEDFADLRKALKLLVESDGDIKVVGEAKTGLEAVQMTGILRPEVILMDISMPLLNGLHATRQIMKIFPMTRVLILSAHSDPEYIEQAVVVGASGYLMKESSTQFLAQAVREVLKGNTYFSASIPKSIRDHCEKVFGKSELLKKKAARLALSDGGLAPPKGLKERRVSFNA
jgi:DNA-binding NarL/FixJ family response regulator